MSVVFPEICTKVTCLKCVTLKGRQVCAEKTTASGSTYLNFRELTPDYEQDLINRFAIFQPSVVTQSPTTASTTSSTTPQVFSVEGFPGFSDHITSPPKVVLLWSVEDSHVTQEYVVDQSSGRIFEKAPIFKQNVTSEDSSAKSPNDLSSALDLPDDSPHTPSEPSPTSAPEDDSSYPTKKLEESIVTPTNVDTSEETTTPVREETEDLSERTVIEPDTVPEETKGFNISNSKSPPKVTRPDEISEIADVSNEEKSGQVPFNSSPPPQSNSTTTTTVRVTTSTGPTPSPAPEPPPTSEGSGLSLADLDLDNSFLTNKSNTPLESEGPSEVPSSPATPTNESSGGFLTGLLDVAGSVVSGVLNVKDSLLDTATSGVSAGISGIIQGASSLGTLAKAKSGKPGKKKTRPKVQSKSNQSTSNLGQSRVSPTTARTTIRTPGQSARNATNHQKQSQRATPAPQSSVETGKKDTSSKTRAHSAKQKPTARPTAKTVSRTSVTTSSTNATKTKSVNSAKHKPTARPTAKPSQKVITPPTAVSTRKPRTSSNNQTNWISKGLDQFGGVNLLTDSLSSLVEHSVKGSPPPPDQPQTPDTYPDYPDYLHYDGIDGSGLTQSEDGETWDYQETSISDHSHRNFQVQPSLPSTTPKSPRTKMPPGRTGNKLGGTNQETKRCGQRIGCSEWGQFKEETLKPFIQLLSNGDGQGLDMFPDDNSGSQLFSKEGLDSFSKTFDSHNAGAPLELSAGIRMLLKFSLATLAQTRMARINSQDQSELSRWTDLGLTLPGLFLGLFYFLYLVRQLHTQWKTNAAQKERRRELDRDARMLRNLQASRRRPAQDRALEMPLRNRRDYDVEAQPEYE